MPEAHLPRWKATALGAAAVYPIAVAAESALLPHLATFPMPLRNAVIALTFSALMTYVTLSALARVQGSWRATERRGSTPPMTASVPEELHRLKENRAPGDQLEPHVLRPCSVVCTELS
jgi:hypothetical protein